MQLLGQMCTCVRVQPTCQFALVCRCAAASCCFFPPQHSPLAVVKAVQTASLYMGSSCGSQAAGAWIQVTNRHTRLDMPLPASVDARRLRCVCMNSDRNRSHKCALMWRNRRCGVDRPRRAGWFVERPVKLSPPVFTAGAGCDGTTWLTHTHAHTHIHTGQEGASTADRPSQTDKFLENRKQCGINSKNMFWANTRLSTSQARCCFTVFTNTPVQAWQQQHVWQRWGKRQMFLSAAVKNVYAYL